MDDFLKYLHEKRFLYQSMNRIFSISKDQLNVASAFAAEQSVEVIDEIITQYEKFVKEREKDVEDLSGNG